MIWILGCGPGSASFLTPAAAAAAAGSAALIGAPSLLALFPQSRAAKIPVTAAPRALARINAARRAGRRVAVLVSGDPGLCSLARFVVARFGRAHCRIVPGISSVQLAFARLGLEWRNARIISAHAQVPDIKPESLLLDDRIAVLAGHPASAAWLGRLIRAMRKTHRVFWCESLSLPQERVAEIKSNSSWRRPRKAAGILMLVRRELVK